MTDAPVDPIDRLLRALAASTLPDAAPLAPLGPEIDPAALVESATAARLLGPLLLAVDAGELALPEAALAHAVERHHQAMQWCLHLEVRLLEVRSWFEQAGGVEHLVVKGPAIAHLDELDPSLRSFADIDLLVAGGDVDRAVEILLARGARRPWAERRAGYDRRFAKSVTLTFEDGVEIDLHRSLCDGVHGFRIPLDRLFARPDHFELGGEQVAALAPTHRLLHAAYHAVLGSPSPRLMSLRDLAGYLTTPGLGPDEVGPELARWRGEAVLALAVREVLATVRFRAPDWERWLEATTVAPAEAAIVDRQRQEGSALGRGKVDALREVRGIGAKAAYARALVWPSRAHLRSRSLRRRDLLP